MGTRALGWLFLSLMLLGACNAPAPHTPDPAPGAPQAGVSARPPAPSKPVEPAPPAEPRPEPRLPHDTGPNGPTLARMVEGEKPDFKVLGQVDSCAECHAEIVGQWRESAHAFSAFANPFYRVSLDDYTKLHGPEKARFCNGCHDIGLQFDAQPAPASHEDRRGFAGVTCATCHGAVEATPEGNGSYVLTTTPIPTPVDGDGGESLARHRARVASAALRTNALCVSCHRGFLSPESGHDVFISGLDEFGPWRHSGYAGSRATRIDAPVKPAGCVDCHMPVGQDGRRVHRFPGGHTALAAAIGAPEQIEANAQLLRTAASLDVMPLVEDGPLTRVVEPDGAASAGGPLRFDVVIRNLATGHRFPGGARDLRDTWLEVVVEDAAGKPIAGSGHLHEANGHEPDTHRMRVVMLDAQGAAVFEHKVGQFRTPIFDRSITPRDAAVARFGVELPEGLAPEAFPLKIKARLRHRRLQVNMHQRTCQDAATDRGKAFARVTREIHGRDVDPCVPQPVLDIAEASLWVGSGASPRNASLSLAPMWQRLWERGLGLEHHVQEKLEEARTSLEAAREALPADAPTWAKAAVISELARVAGLQGRTDDAEALLAEAARHAPDHPALALIRGEAHAQVWRWEKAAEGYREVTRLAPDDARGWQGLAISLGSLGRREESLRAAERGLRLEPRDPHLLRSQSLAWSHLAPGSPEAEAAREAWLTHRRDDQAPTIKGDCKDPTSDCQKERVAIFTRPLKPIQ